MLDIQVNGLFKKQLCDCNFWDKPNKSQILKLCTYFAQQNIKSFLATLITSSFDEFCHNLTCIEAYVEAYQEGNLSMEDLNFDISENYIGSLLYGNMKARLVGVHIEGGLISRLGIHPANHAQVFNYQNVKELLTKFGKLIKLWTICPLKDSAGDITRLLQDHGILVSYGHSLASFEEVHAHYEKFKVNCVTHLGNAMPLAKDMNVRSLSRNDLDILATEPTKQSELKDFGLAYWAIHQPDVYASFICGDDSSSDKHLSTEFIELLLKTKDRSKLILTSDCVHYFDSEDRAPRNLVGGLNDLSVHAANLKTFKVEQKIIQKLTWNNPKNFLGL